MNNAVYSVFKINKNSPVFVIGLFFQNPCSTDELWSVLEKGFAITSNLSSNITSEFYLNELESNSFSNHLHQFCSKVLQLIIHWQPKLGSSYLEQVMFLKGFHFSKHHIHGVNHLHPSAWAAIMVWIMSMFLAVLGTMVQLYGLYMRQSLGS